MLDNSAAQPDIAAVLKPYIRAIPDFPEPGILFRDITPLLGNAAALHTTINALTAPYRQGQIDVVIGIESRGFLFGIPVAYLLNVGFVPVRKKGKLPHQTIAAEYILEYGTNTVEMHADAIQPGQRVLIIDDLLATGGTAAASVRLVRQLGAEIAGLAFVIELTPLHGRARLADYPVHSLLQY